MLYCNLHGCAGFWSFLFIHSYNYLLCSLTLQPFGLFQYIFSYACKTQLQSHSTLSLFCIYSCLDKSTHQYSLILNKCTLSSSWILVLSSDSFNFLHKFSLTLLDDYFTSLSNIHLYHSLLLLFWSLKKKLHFFF